LKIKNQQDFFAGLLFMALGLVFAIGALDYRLGPECLPSLDCAGSLWGRFVRLSSAPGPGYFPLGLGALLAFLGGLLVFKSLTLETEDGGRLGDVAWRPLILVVLSIVCFAFLVTYTGFYVAAAVSMAVAMLADAEANPPRVLIAAVLGLALSLGVVIWLTPQLEIAFGAVLRAMAGDAVPRYVVMTLVRSLCLVATVLVVRRLPARVKPTGVLVALFFVLIAGSVWVFAQALGLPMPLLPAAFN
jgi:hypothetical protein